MEVNLRTLETVPAKRSSETAHMFCSLKKNFSNEIDLQLSCRERVIKNIIMLCVNKYYQVKCATMIDDAQIPILC